MNENNIVKSHFITVALSLGHYQQNRSDWPDSDYMPCTGNGLSIHLFSVKCVSVTWQSLNRKALSVKSQTNRTIITSLLTWSIAQGMRHCTSVLLLKICGKELLKEGAACIAGKLIFPGDKFVKGKTFYLDNLNPFLIQYY